MIIRVTLLSLLLILISCNESEFYDKPNLDALNAENPRINLDNPVPETTTDVTQTDSQDVSPEDSFSNEEGTPSTPIVIIDPVEPAIDSSEQDPADDSGSSDTVIGDNGTTVNEEPIADNGSNDSGEADSGSNDTVVDNGSNDSGTTDSGSNDTVVDNGSNDSGTTDSGSNDTVVDNGSNDSGTTDSGSNDPVVDNGSNDSGTTDSGSNDPVVDNGSNDSGTTDSGSDDTVADSGSNDSGTTDSGSDDAVADNGSNDSGTTDSGSDDTVADNGSEPNPEDQISDQFKTIVDQFIQDVGEKQKVDILWTVDNSGSMRGEQEDLARNFDAFIKGFLDKEIDFRMSITTTDARKGHSGRMIPGHTKQLTSEAAAENKEKFIRQFKKYIQVGTNGSPHEKGLKTSWDFFKRYGDDFLREDAYLIVVIVSDEEDQSPSDVEQYVQSIQSLKSNSGFAKIYSIVNTKDNFADSNQFFKYSRRGIFKNSIGFNEVGNRYVSASELSGGLVADITDDFHGILESWGGSIVDLATSFALTNVPYNNDLTVKINGDIAVDWDYDPITRSIRFDDSVPSEGATIEVVYDMEVSQ